MKTTIYLLAGLLGFWLASSQLLAQTPDDNATSSSMVTSLNDGDVILIPAKVKFTYGGETLVLEEEESGSISLPNSNNAINAEKREISAYAIFSLFNHTDQPLIFKIAGLRGEEELGREGITLAANETKQVKMGLVFPIDEEFEKFNLVILPTEKGNDPIVVFTTKLLVNSFTL